MPIVVDDLLFDEYRYAQSILQVFRRLSASRHAGLHRLKLVVFRRLAAGLRNGILLRIEQQFFARRLREIDIQLVAQPQQEQQHVGAFQSNFRACFRWQVGRLLERQPLEMLKHFTGFARQRHRQVLGIVKLVPVAFRRELSQPRAQDFQVVGTFSHA